jgi:serine/threonine-protein kinase
MLGEIINGYRIKQWLGRGGMGEVWMAEQQIATYFKVAIKILLPAFSNDPLIVDRFFDEAKAVCRIKHAGIAKIHASGHHNESAYLIMDLLEGETLAGRIRRMKRLPLANVGELGKQISSVLEATHAENIIHRDLKPDNIFLVQDREPPGGERVKILDFGIAKLGSTAGRTGLGPMGTAAYMAPELWTDPAAADARTDVFSVGCIAFEMCCGEPPFGGSTIVANEQDAPRTRSLAPEVPPALDDIIARALARRPADRPSMRELHKVFSSVAAEHPLEPGTTPPRMALRRTPGWPRRRLQRMAIGAGAFACLASVVYVATQRRTRTPSESQIVPRAPVVNAWVRVEVPATPVVLGIRRDDALPSVRGFRPGRQVVSPGAPYELQEHEVTWSEIEPWLATSGTSLAIPTWARDPSERSSLPVTGVTWSIARAYCRSLSLSGDLPTEEQWEYAARGPERRPSSWGQQRLDLKLTHAYAGQSAIPVAVKSSVQDRTPDPGLYDLIGNVQEWMLELWREDLPGLDERWVTPGPETTIGVIRGLPLGENPPPAVPEDSAAYREPLCATGPCVEKTVAKLRHVGFRCARARG